MTHTTSGPLRIGLVGCGRAAERIYLPAFGRVPRARLAAVTDPDADRRALVTQAAGVPGFADVEAMLTGCELDAVVVAAPPEAHADVARAALRRSLAVLVEKPLAPDLAGARRIADAAAAAKRPVMVGFNRRRLPAAERLRRLLADVDHSTLEFSSEFHALPDAWDPVAGVRDPIDDLASHHLDLFRFLAGSDISAVDAERRGGAVELAVRLESGARGRCIVSQGRANRERLAVVVREEAGGDGASGPDDLDPRWLLRPSSDRLRPAGGIARMLLDRVDKLRRRAGGRPDPMARSFAAQLEAFVACVRAGVPPSPDVGDGMAVVRAVEAARRSLG